MEPSHVSKESKAGHISIAIFQEQNQGTTIDRLISSVRKSPRAEGFNEILIPGEPERREEAKRSKAGIPIPDTSWESIRKICRDYGLDALSLVQV